MQVTALAALNRAPSPGHPGLTGAGGGGLLSHRSQQKRKERDQRRVGGWGGKQPKSRGNEAVVAQWGGGGGGGVRAGWQSTVTSRDVTTCREEPLEYQAGNRSHEILVFKGSSAGRGVDGRGCGGRVCTRRDGPWGARVGRLKGVGDSARICEEAHRGRWVLPAYSM